MPTKSKQSRIMAIINRIEPYSISYTKNTVKRLYLKNSPQNEKELVAVALYCFEHVLGRCLFSNFYFKIKSLKNIRIYAQAKVATSFSCVLHSSGFPVAHYERYQIKIEEDFVTVVEPPKLEEFLTSKYSAIRLAAKKGLTNGN